ncbi:hypothetical protein ASH00_05350 [Arthrobacter sp. Soil782]|uniref:hypothetical protein n=1 Tax=Arthrobacter sp. Soil782 TaxID=1736410 RepID=UPI0006FF76BD|nr:hypothetical protein [Arthrobacter sp. Soil782]KRF09084.1 hypothetical protein ASH00_05350 [Arthrobacter sp. Soil782]
MADRKPLSQRFMKATGKLRMFFGPADQGGLEGPVKYAYGAAHQQRQQELQQWDVVRNVDGSTYLVKREDGDK